MERIDTKFAEAVSDLVWLLDRGYPKKSALDLVGNRHSLDHDERMILQRGVFETASAAARRKKRCDPFQEPVDPLLVDGYNVLITIESFLAGKRVFRSADGFVRDVSGVYGNHAFGELTEKGILLLAEFFKSIPGIPGRGRTVGPEVTVFLDSPVSRSGELASHFRSVLLRSGVAGDVKAVQSPDGEIVRAAGDSPFAAVATSDTAIIDKVRRCVDVPDLLLGGVLRKIKPQKAGPRRDILDLSP